MDFQSPAWFKHGLCRGLAFRTTPENTDKYFFPKSCRSAEIKYTKIMCRGCPVINDCLQYALDNGEEGIWGGTTDTERRRLRSRNVA